MGETVALQKLTEFSLNEALSGATVAIEDADGNVIYGSYFRYENGVYKCEVGGKTLTFDRNGVGLSSQGGYQLKVVDDTITAATDATGTRADGTTAEIAELNARDTFAMRAMQAMLGGVDRPLNMSDATIKQYAAKAYTIAAAMMNEAAEHRSEAAAVEGEEVSSEE